MENTISTETFALILRRIAKKIKKYPSNYSVDCFHIKIWKQRNDLFLTIPILRNGKDEGLRFNFKINEAMN